MVAMSFEEDVTPVGSELDVVQPSVHHYFTEEVIQLRLCWVYMKVWEQVDVGITGGTGMIDAFDCAGDPGSLSGSLTATGAGGEDVAVEFDFTW